jgi:hypothetical protein
MQGNLSPKLGTRILLLWLIYRLSGLYFMLSDYLALLRP